MTAAKLSLLGWSWSWSWSSSCGRQSVDQFVWVSGLPLGPLTTFYLALLFSSDNFLILLSKASSLTRKRVCNLQCNHTLVPITVFYRLIWDCVLFLSPLTTRRDYDGGILTRLHTGQPLRFGLCIPFIGSGPTYWKPFWLLHSCAIRCIATDCCVWTDKL
jgi:hypothetical protein